MKLSLSKKSRTQEAKGFSDWNPLACQASGTAFLIKELQISSSSIERGTSPLIALPTFTKLVLTTTINLL